MSFSESGRLKGQQFRIHFLQLCVSKDVYRTYQMCFIPTSCITELLGSMIKNILKSFLVFLLEKAQAQQPGAATLEDSQIQILNCLVSTGNFWNGISSSGV